MTLHSNLHFLNPSYKNQCSGIAFFGKGIVNGWTLNFCYFFLQRKIIRNAIVPGASVSVFCLNVSTQEPIYITLIEQINPVGGTKPSPTTYHISSVLINTTVNCQETNLKTALLWLLSFRWESIEIICLVLLQNLSYFQRKNTLLD